jgi:hypothetical protein
MSTSGACAGGPKAEIAMVDDDEVSGSEAQRHGWHGSPCSAPPLARRPSGERVQLHLLGERLLPQTGELLLSSFPGERRLPQLGELLLPAAPISVMRRCDEPCSAAYPSSSSRRCCGSIAPASANERLNAAASKRCAPPTKPPWRTHAACTEVSALVYLIKYVHKGEGPYWFITF